MTTARPSRTLGPTLRYLGGGRVREAALMVGFPLAGPVFALDALSLDAALRVGAFALGMFMLFLAVYEFNDYCGHGADALNPRRAGGLEHPRGRHLKRTAGALAAALAVLGSLQPALALGALVSFALWGVYSWPIKGWKEVPVLGTGVHFVTQSLHFVMGWSIVAGVTADALLVSFFFAGLFAGGHLFHEVIDYEADRDAGVRTTANRLGRRTALHISTGLFAASGAYWGLLRAGGRIAEPAFVAFAGALVVHAAALAAFGAAGRLESRAGALRLRATYRMVYLLAGLGFVAHKFGANVSG